MANRLTKGNVYLRYSDEPLPEASAELQRQGYNVLRGVLGLDEVATLRAEVEEVFDALDPDVRRPARSEIPWNDFRYELLNRSAAAQRMVCSRVILDVVEPLLGEDCHVIANTAWRNPAGADFDHGGGFWHIDAGPHVPRPAGIPWDERIPYPVFAVAVHVLLAPMPIESGPTGVIPFSHTSGQPPPPGAGRSDDLSWEGRDVVPLVADVGDVAMFVSDVWHRRLSTQAGDPGRFFVQIHYGRRDIAQRLRPTGDVNHLSEEALNRVRSERDRSVLGLHDPLFYDG